MNGILDQIISNHTNGNNGSIISENHDINGINIDVPDFDSLRADNVRSIMSRYSWDAAEYGVSREEAIRRIEQANTEEARQETIRSLRQAAQRRASLDTSNGRVAVMWAGEAPWHGLGVGVSQAQRSSEAIVLSGLNFTVEKRPLYYQWANDYVCDEDNFALVRTDTGARLGTVGKKYKPIQNAVAFEFLDSVLQEFGATYETAGSLFGGKKVWLLAKMPSFAVKGQDEVIPYALFTNPHDGSGAAYCFGTTHRVVCANTHRVAMRDGAKAKGIRLRHDNQLENRIEDAKQALGLAAQAFSEFKETADIMASVKVEPRRFFNNVLDEVLEVTEAQAEMGANALAAALKATNAAISLEEKEKEFQRKLDNRASLLADIVDRFESERCGAYGLRGTAWSAYNAVSELADHGDYRRYRGSETDKASRRFESIVSGDADELKQVAFSLAANAARS